MYALFLFIVNWRRWSLDLELTPESPGGNKGGGEPRQGGKGNRVMDGATYWNKLETTGCYFHYSVSSQLGKMHLHLGPIPDIPGEIRLVGNLGKKARGTECWVMQLTEKTGCYFL